MRIVWAVVLQNKRWTEVQWRLLIASIRSWKKYNFSVEDTCVLYGDSSLFQSLEKLGCLNLWDELVEDKSTYSHCFTNASWDYPKVEALYREGQKVFYVDYDVIFFDRIREELDRSYNWFWEKEDALYPWYYKPGERIEELSVELDNQIFRNGIAYNVGTLFLDYDCVVSWTHNYESIFSTENDLGSLENSNKLTLTISQCHIVGIVPKETVRFIKQKFYGKVKHYLGWAKYNLFHEGYSNLLREDFNTFLEPNFSKKLITLGLSQNRTLL